VPFGVLHAIAELSEDQCRQGLTRLQAAEFLYEARLFPNLEYTFKHALTHDVSYGSLLQDRRRALHARLVEAIERLPRRRDLVEQSIDVRVELRAVLFPLSEFERVRDHLSQAAMLAGKVGDRPRLGRIAALQAHYHCIICIIAGDMSQALECARRAMAIAEAGAIPSHTGVTGFTLGQVQHGCGDYIEAIETLETNIQFLAGEKWT
jgi:hypothetical protein